jgi:hypothetical protein
MKHAMTIIRIEMFLIIALLMISHAQQTPGTWKDVTPVPYMPGAGAEGLLCDPARPSDLYVNFDEQGIWRSTDYGENWKKVNTGMNADKLNSGRAWSSVMGSTAGRDPQTAPTLYYVMGWGAGCVWKSTDFGVNWANVWNNNIFLPNGTNVSSDVGGDIAALCNPDVSDPNHLIASLHSYGGSGGNNGVFETTNGGVTWVDHRASFNFQVHSDQLFAIDRNTWMVSHFVNWPGGELWRTADGGNSWNKVLDLSDAGGGLKVFRHGSAAYAGVHPWRVSRDKGVTWTAITSGGPACGDDAMFGSATTLYCGRSANGGLYDPACKLYSTPIDNVGSIWTEIPLPASMHVQKPVGDYNPSGFYIGSSIIRDGAATSDGIHTILVTANFSAGIWRYVEPVTTTASRTAMVSAFHQDVDPKISLKTFLSGKSFTRNNTGASIYGLMGQKIEQGSVKGKGLYIVKQ